MPDTESAMLLAIAMERERCAKIAENFRSPNPYPTVYAAIAAAIRANRPIEDDRPSEVIIREDRDNWR
jgi:hypothetical protein